MNQSKPQPILLIALAGFCVMCLALGLDRFAYTPLLPVMVDKGWLTERIASYIGSVNFLGYLFGAIIAKRLTHYKSAQFWVYVNLILCVLSLLACVIHFDVAWLFFWRAIAGFSGAILMVLTPPIIYKAIHKHHVALVSGIMFGGIGAGIIYGSLIVPALANYAIAYIWGAIAALGLLLTIVGMIFLPRDKSTVTATHSSPSEQTNIKWHIPIILAFLAYILFGYGAVPHLLYMVAYIEQALKGSIVIANLGWLIYGIGNTIGSPIFGYLSKHIGIKKCLALTYFIACISISILFLSHHPWIGLISFALNGIVANSIVSLTSSYLTTLAPHSQQTHFWGIFTVFVAMAQTSGSAIMANWMGTSAGFNLMFTTSAIAMLLAGILIILKRKKAI